MTPLSAARRERHRAGKLRLGAHCTERPEVNQDKPDPRETRLREIFEILHIDRLHDQCSWNAPASTLAFRHIPSLRCQEIRHAFRERKKMLSAWMQQSGGARRDRTDDLLLAKQALSQLSYGPDPDGAHQRGSIPPLAQHADVVGLGRFELPTSRLSSARSNQLSYRPEVRASMRRKRNVGGGVPQVFQSG